MFLSLFIILPLILGIAFILVKEQKQLHAFGFLLSAALFALMLYLLYQGDPEELTYEVPWFAFNHLQAFFAFNAQGLSGLMVLLSTLVFTILFLYLSSIKHKYDNRFYGLLLLTFAGLNGVFLVQDLILFYFFWEIVLIPTYFLIGIWGEKKTRISANMTFFLYTVLGSMLMLAGIIYIGFYLRPSSFLIQDVRAVTQSFNNSSFLAILFLLAFAVKIPLFPFHTWQPEVYKTAPTPVTVVLSALMAKMGLFAIVNWFLYLFPTSSDIFVNYLYIVAFGVIYASLLALASNNIKKIIAYSSIAHLALVFIALYSGQETGVYAAYFQMFSHGLVVLGLWLCVDIMERKYHIKDLKSVGGLATENPTLAILFMIFGLANIGLPLTSSFIGEFMMLNALFAFNPVLCVMGCAGVILSAVYTLRLLSAVLFGKPHNLTHQDEEKDMKRVYVGLAVVAIIIIVLGIYPMPIFNLLVH